MTLPTGDALEAGPPGDAGEGVPVSQPFHVELAAFPIEHYSARSIQEDNISQIPPFDQLHLHVTSTDGTKQGLKNLLPLNSEGGSERMVGDHSLLFRSCLDVERRQRKYERSKEPGKDELKAVEEKWELETTLFSTKAQGDEQLFPWKIRFCVPDADYYYQVVPGTDHFYEDVPNIDHVYHNPDTDLLLCHASCGIVGLDKLQVEKLEIMSVGSPFQRQKLGYHAASNEEVKPIKREIVC
ncbi:hypothetical protein AcV5_002929 [Taiwanofungus camphoratus]|nr:hypothetical protein AcV5_002929 [Antrodia cinnamomea]